MNKQIHLFLAIAVVAMPACATARKTGSAMLTGANAVQDVAIAPVESLDERAENPAVWPLYPLAYPVAMAGNLITAPVAIVGFFLTGGN